MPIRTKFLDSLLQYQDKEFVQQAYLSLLLRPVDDEGLDFYLHRLRNGSRKIQVLFEIFNSPERQKSGLHAPDLREQFAREGLFEAYENPAETVTRMAESRDVHKALLDLGNHDFIEAAYKMLLRRHPDEAAATFYEDRLLSGVSKTQILMELFQSAERHSIELTEVAGDLPPLIEPSVNDVEHLFIPSSKAPTVAKDLSELLRHNGHQFIECAYLTVLKRHPDSGGLQHYNAELLSGVSKIHILMEICDSDEGRAKSSELPGLKSAIRCCKFAQLPIVGGLIGRLLDTDKNSFDARRQRAQEQAAFVALNDTSAKIDLAEQRSYQELSALRLDANTRFTHIEQRITQLKEASLIAAQLSEGVAHFGSRIDDLQKYPRTDAVAEIRVDRLEQRLVQLQQTCLYLEQLPLAYLLREENVLEMGLPDHSPPALTFFTICSKNFTAYAKTLFDSVRVHHPLAEIFMFLCDGVDSGYDTSQLPFTVVSLTQLDIPDLLGMTKRYNITEFNTSIKPYAFSYLFKLKKDQIIYLDPDIILTSPLVEAIEEFASGADCLLTPHILQPAENVDVSDNKMLLFGIYNLGFIGLRNTPCVNRVVEWWGRRLERHCIIDIPNGLFVDQKWADLLPAFIGRTTILHHPGYNVAYWNLSQRTVEFISGIWYSNRQPLRFVHFSGNKLDDPHVFSRHTASFNRDNIGDLKHLLDSYRNQVFANGHAAYSKLPYSFGWNGESGTNLHTPQPEDSVASVLHKRTIASRFQQWMPQLLFIDWSTPRPDCDAGSLTAYHLLKIYVDLGYDVTFIPSDLQHLGAYTQAVEALGVRCLHKAEIDSVAEYLRLNGNALQFVLICRAPIAHNYIDDIRKFAPEAKIILNTSDLHYLRDTREAEIEGNAEKIEAANRAKNWELDVIRRCDVTIVMSPVELNILKIEIPSGDFRLIPLMFVDAVHDCPPFEDRRDILFIGGFPHAPNVDAVIYFCNEIFPLVRKRMPHLNFHIVGNKPPEKVQALADISGVIVHGYMKDIAPIFRSCRLSVAPLRYGAGIKGKIGTSLSFGVPVVATSVAVEGMEVEAELQLLIADSPQDFTDAIYRAYNSKALWTQLSENGRNQMLRTYSPAAGSRRISSLMSDINPQRKNLDIYTLRSLNEYCALNQVIGGDLSVRAETERSLIRYDAPNFFTEGFCAICGDESKFNTSFMYSYEFANDGKPIPNWREHLNCVKCGFTNRIRAALHVFYSRMKPWDNADIYITEQTTALFKWLKERHPNLTGSEYLGNIVALGAESGGLRNEDLTALTFPDNSFDFVLSFDVMEHVSDDTAALEQVYRCLKPGGIFLFAAPFSKDRSEKVIRAQLLKDGSIEHILPPEYHGNPVDHENGALCFRYFAWDLITDMESVGFTDAHVLHYWSRDFAYFGVEQFMFVGRKEK